MNCNDSKEREVTLGGPWDDILKHASLVHGFFV